MENKEIIISKIHQLRTYALNITALTDISFLINLFDSLNKETLTYEEKILLNETLSFMIEEVTRDKANEDKIEIVKDIINNYIFNNLEINYYYYYLLLRETLLLDSELVDDALDNLIEEISLREFDFINEFQKISFINYLSIINETFKRDSIKALIEKIKDIKLDDDQKSYPKTSPSKIEKLEEQNNQIQEELASISYSLMIEGLM